jgi:PIN domain nuclease of toxin-antitoxin system
LFVQLLLDTHALFWFLCNSPSLSATASQVIADPNNQIFVSAVGAWEITTKVRSGKWPAASQLAQTFGAAIASQGFIELAITVEHACLAGSMAVAHRDPFDRMLAAQSKIEDMPVISIDALLDQFAITRIW